MEIKFNAPPFLFLRKRIILTIMKTFILLFCTSVFGFTPNSMLSQNSKIKIHIDKNLSVDEVFELIIDQTDYKFIYEEGMFKGIPSIAVKKGSISTQKLLNKSLANGNFNVIVTKNNTILIKKKSIFSNLIQQEINGIVTDESGEPIPGVTVLIKGTRNGVSTDINGFYSIKVPNQENVLIFSALGFTTQELTVGNKTTINITLLENIESLKEIVLISDGYQKISKERATGSYVNISTEQIEQQVTSNVIASLEGLAPGLTLNNTSNGLATTASAPSLFIRGIGSFGNTAPLIVLDGFPINQDQLNLINSQDIASVNILKDASAASIWGSGAANGVIVITTKKGTQEKTQFTFRNALTFKGRPSLDYLNFANSKEAVDYEKALFYRDPNDLPTREDLEDRLVIYPKSYDILLDFNEGIITEQEMERRLANLSSYNNSKDLEKAFLNAPIVNTTNFSLNGKTEKSNYFASIALVSEEGEFKDDKRETVTINLNTDYNFSDKTKLNIGVNYFTQDENVSPLRDGLTSISSVPTILKILPYEKLTDAQGNAAIIRRNTPNSFINELKNLGGKDLSYKPLNELESQDFSIKSNSIRFNGTLHRKIFKGLDASISYQYLKSSINNNKLYKSQSFFTRQFLTEYSRATFDDDNNLTNVEQIYPDGSIEKNNLSSLTSNITRFQLDYNTSFNNRKHIIKALIGLERRQQLSEGDIFTRFGYNESNLLFSLINEIPDIQENPYGSMPNLAQLDALYDKTKIDTRISSYYFNAGYAFKNKYDFNISGRIDRSSQFSRNKEFLGSLGLKWNITNENFFNIDWVNNLQLRGTIGILGNSPAIGEASLTTTANPNVNFVTGLPSLNIINPANKALTFETVETRNIALDFSLFNSRVNASVDYYHKISSNVLAQGNIDPTYGFYTIKANVADIINKGAEIQLNTKNIVSKDFNWSSSVNFSTYKNTVEKSITDKNEAFGSRAIQLKGYPAYSAFGYKYAGLDSNGLPQAFYTTDTGTIEKTSAESDIKFTDLKHLGSYIPTTTIGFTNTFNYKDFQLFFRLAYNGGHIIRRERVGSGSATANRSFDNGFLTGYNSNTLNYWQQAGDENITDTPALVSILENKFRENADLGFTDGDFLKLRQVILSYSIQPNLISKTPFTSATIYAQGDNLWYWAKNNDGIDPEAYIGQYGERTFEIRPSYSLGVTLKF